MIVRSYEPSDLDELKRIHAANFQSEFNQPDFLDYVCAYVVEDEQGILTFGGLRDIAECVTVTDKSRDPHERLKALYMILDVSTFVAKQTGYDQLYAFSQNPKWARRLRRNGFRPPQGEALILDL